MAPTHHTLLSYLHRGRFMAQFEVKLLVATLLQNFTFKLQPGEEEKISYSVMITVRWLSCGFLVAFLVSKSAPKVLQKFSKTRTGSLGLGLELKASHLHLYNSAMYTDVVGQRHGHRQEGVQQPLAAAYASHRRARHHHCHCSNVNTHPPNTLFAFSPCRSLL